ncbi:hypothetical protein [Natrinema pallidum]|uniref:hypothetical protein n=1 Tax=Natrinema pallidum TaxID=69527 RepID=UPI0037511599
MPEFDRTIRKEEQGVTIELLDEEAENGFMRMEFTEVRLLSNGWVEAREPDEEDRINFFPPWKVQNIIVYDEDQPSGAW